jgi:hydroxylamine dehydrogenase
MRKIFLLFLLLLVLSVFLFAEKRSLYKPDGSDMCITCHSSATPGIVQTWSLSRHSERGVSCEVCHTAQSGDPSGFDHYGKKVTSVPSPNYCASCHPVQVEENTRSKHAWTAFMGQYKPYYTEARSRGLDPFSQDTARLLDPDAMAKTVASPLIPDSGVLKKTGILDNPDYNHNNITLGCSQCHGTFVIAENGKLVKGWPNTGVGRINPDGSIGSCSSCHTRHKYSIEEARKPDTCGQCHLGPDHPQHEIYEESKHGNIFASSGEEWNWTDKPGKWGPEDVDAPTCAVCHMSAFGNVKKSTHDVGERLYWELQPKVSVPQWKGPDEVDMVLERVADKQKAEQGRINMEAICMECHSSGWVNGHFEEFDKVVSDYNMVWSYTDNLLKEAYEKGLADKAIPVDETPEIMHYLIWHHSGRRWRMGAAMMGPDWTHWNGAVDTILINLGTMINDIELRERLSKLE